ncbi:MAG: isoprenyl transferase [Candidatus Omnitrophota bacterium]|jgi:undecaprenyl diphosphate synthase|nr:MAG: isoprenyl transferase [Candidatus Omnitrophota bacterium]
MKIVKKGLPEHVAVIMDGNGRWARQRGLPRTVGHRQGMKRVKELIETAVKAGIKVLTLFAFSTENWSRPKREIVLLMNSLGAYLDRNIGELKKNDIRFRVIGRTEQLPSFLRVKIKSAQEHTKANAGMALVLAFNYGARQEIVDAARGCARSVQAGTLVPEDIDEEEFRTHLYAADLPDVDLLIRTSGELRISNFLLWQLSYAELYFPKKYWPDFCNEDLFRAIKEFQRRKRRFGGIDVDEKNN